jgi:hypothetical protein
LWLQQNVFKSRNLRGVYYYNANNDAPRQKVFIEAVSNAEAGTFYLAKGRNGAILGAMTFAKIKSTPGLNPYGPGETLIFSVTNKKV